MRIPFKFLALQVAFATELAGVFATLRVLMDPSPRTAKDAGEFAKAIRLLLAGQSSSAWVPVNDAIDGEKDWRKFKTEYRRTVLNDHRIAGQFAATLSSLDGDTAANPVAEAIPKLAEWKAVARPGARREIEDGVMTRLEKDLCMLQQQDTTEESVLSTARELDQLTS